MIQSKRPTTPVLFDAASPELLWLIETSADGILVVDRGGVVRFANEAAEHLFGRSRDTLIDAPVGVAVVAGETGQATLARPALSPIEVEIRTVATLWNGAPALLASLRAVTASRAGEQALHQTQRLEAISQFTTGVAHDFNNILTSIMGNLELALSSASDERLWRLLNNAVRSSERAAQLINHLLACARKQDLTVQPVDLNCIVASAEEIFGRTLAPSIQMSRTLDAALWPASADQTQIEVALLNLMINARDAMPEGGRLKIATRNLDALSADRPPELPSGAFVALSVSDSGAGMSDSVKAKAFEPFFTMRDIGKGSGLGLSTVYGLMRQLGGLVTIDSTLGQGTRVTLYLPRVETATQPGDGAAPRILVVDDDHGVREVVRMALESHGYAIVDVANGRIALDLIQRGEPFGMIVTDLSMPGLRGSELAAEARRLRPGLPVLIITGYEPGDLDPAQPLLRKPFRTTELVARIADCLGQPRPPDGAIDPFGAQRVGTRAGRC